MRSDLVDCCAGTRDEREKVSWVQMRDTTASPYSLTCEQGWYQTTRTSSEADGRE